MFKRFVRGTIGVCLCIAMLWALIPIHAAHAPADGEARAESILGTPLFCLRCSQRYTNVFYDMQREAGNYVPADGVTFEVLNGITFEFMAADDRSSFGLDVDRAKALVELIDAAVPEQYRRQSVDHVVIMLSSEDYCLHYDAWTPRQKRSLVPEIETYFTSDSSQQNVLGCCMSFPHTDERERYVWLATGKYTGNPGRAREHVNCAYSYHLYCSEEALLVAQFIHEVTHALTLTMTMPSLEEYGFKANPAWEQRQLSSNGAVPALYSVEALAYDITVEVMQADEPAGIFAITPVVNDPQETEPSDDAVMWVEVDTDTQIAQVTWLENNTRLATIEDDAVPLAGGTVAADSGVAKVVQAFEEMQVAEGGEGGEPQPRWNLSSDTVDVTVAEEEAYPVDELETMDIMSILRTYGNQQ